MVNSCNLIYLLFDIGLINNFFGYSDVNLVYFIFIFKKIILK